MIFKPTLVNEKGEPIKFPKLRKFYRKPECKNGHGRVYVHKSKETGKFRCVRCNKEL